MLEVLRVYGKCHQYGGGASVISGDGQVVTACFAFCGGGRTWRRGVTQREAGDGDVG